MAANSDDLENEIYEYPQAYTPVTLETLIEAIRERHANETGYSQKTLYRKLNELIDKDYLVEVDRTSLKAYGITPRPGKGKYVVLRVIAEQKGRLANALELLSKDDLVDIRVALDEIIRYQEKHDLAPHQLDNVVSLVLKDVVIAERALAILLEHATMKGIYPLNTPQFLQTLKEVLPAFEQGGDVNPNLRKPVIYLLGFYNDREVVAQLKRDAKDLGTLQRVQDYYMTAYTARIIELYGDELLELERTLRKERQVAVADILAKIRDKARDLVSIPVRRISKEARQAAPPQRLEKTQQEAGK